MYFTYTRTYINFLCTKRRSIDDTLVPNCIIHLKLSYAYPNSNNITSPLPCTRVGISGVAMLRSSICRVLMCNLYSQLSLATGQS